MGERVWEFVEELAADAKERVLAFVRENPIKILPLAADAKERVPAFVRENLIKILPLASFVREYLIKILPLAADAKERVLAFVRENLIKILPLPSMRENLIKSLPLAVLLLALYCFCSSSSCAGQRMMKAPGRKGATMPRTSFERNPRAYFKDLRGRKE